MKTHVKALVVGGGAVGTGIAYHLAKLNLPQGLEAAILILATFAGCFATYEVVRRIPGVRWLFGLKSQPRAEASRPPVLA